MKIICGVEKSNEYKGISKFERKITTMWVKIKTYIRIRFYIIKLLTLCDKIRKWNMFYSSIQLNEQFRQLSHALRFYLEVSQ